MLCFLLDFEACSLCNLSNDPRGLIHFLGASEERIQSLRWNTQQQTTTGLRIKEQHLICFPQRRTKPDVWLKILSVVERAAGKDSFFCIAVCTGNKGNIVKYKFQGHPRGLSHFQTMTKETVAGNVGSSADPKFYGQLARRLVQLLHPLHGFENIRLPCLLLLQGCGCHTKSEWF